MANNSGGGCCLIYGLILLCMIGFGALSKCSCSTQHVDPPKKVYTAPIHTDNPDLKCPQCGGAGKRWINHGHHLGRYYVTCDKCNGSGLKNNY